jgi:predicted SAM-dependent methyltransferase
VLGRWKIKKQIRTAAKSGKIKIIVGSGGTDYEGWIATDLPHFDLLKKADWEYFLCDKKIDNILAEHVIEHLTKDDVDIVLSFAANYLAKGGRFRIAVPDGFHPSPEYFDYVSPTGKTGSLHGHLFLWDFISLSAAAQKAGLRPVSQEYYSEERKFNISPYSFDDGFVRRSIKNNYIDTEIENYSSLIVDLIKD